MIHSSPFKLFAIIAASAFYSISLFSAESKIRIMKSALAKNPTIFCKGVAGSASLTKRVEHDVSHCGWFNVVNMEYSAEYTLSGSITGRKIRFILKRGGISDLSFSMPFNNKKIVSISQRAIDHILKRLFKVKKLCRSKIAFCAETKPGRKEIFVCDYDGGNIKRITRNGTLSVEPNWGPQQKRLIYTMYGRSNTDIVQYDLSSRRSRRLIHFPGLNSGAAVSPDGKYFAVILSKDGSVDLYLKSLTTKLLMRLTQGKSAESSPCWSPSGAKICYVSDMSGLPRLYVLSVNKKSRKRLETFGTESVSPDWSSEGNIIYSAKMGRYYALALYDVSGENAPRIVIAAEGDWEDPSWAPDNRHVVASRKLHGRSDLYVIDTWTGSARSILTDRIQFSMPSW